MTLIGLDDLRERYEGRANNGTVSLRAYDEGIVLSLGAELWTSLTSKDANAPLESSRPESLFPGFFVQVNDLSPPEGYPGTPILWSQPEDQYQKAMLPGFEIERGDILPAMNRWHPGSLQFRAPSSTAQSVTVNGKTSFDEFAQRQQAVPFDISYTIYCEVAQRTRGRNAANAMLLHALKKFPPYSFVALVDSLGDVRTYDVTMEGVSALDETQDVTKRRLGFSLALRVAAELDLSDEYTKKAISERPSFTFSQT